MIYLLTHNGGCLIVVDDGNLERLKQHKPALTPDGKVQIVYQPDLLWVAEELEKLFEDDSISGKSLAEVLEKGKDRPVKPLPDGMVMRDVMKAVDKRKEN